MAQKDAPDDPPRVEREHETFPPTVVVASADPASPEVKVRVNAPEATSQAGLQGGEVSIDLQGPALAGTRAEGRVMKTLAQKLRNDGHAVEVERGIDSRGEDAKIRVDQLPVRVVQILTAPADAKLWRATRHGAASGQTSLPGAVQWLRSAIEKKASRTPLAQRAEMFLAVDAEHAGVLAAPAVCDAYLDRFGDPVVEFGFAAVWVVGPTVPYCTHIGRGEP